MNGWDQIKAKALDAVGATGLDDADGNRRADDLIKLMGLMIEAVGKVVSSEGESDMSACRRDGEEYPGERLDASVRYSTGEHVQSAARDVVADVRDAELKRYEEHGGAPVWRPKCPDCKRRPGVHENVSYGSGGRTFDLVQHAEDCPQRCRECSRIGDLHKLDCSLGRLMTCAAGSDDNHRCGSCNRIERFGHMLNCPLRQLSAPTTPCPNNSQCPLCLGPDDHGDDCVSVR